MSPDASWTPAPVVLVACALALAVYARRWRRARSGRPPHAPGLGRLVAFAGGIALVLVALVSPVDRLADQVLFMHMVQHIILLDLAPILLILGLTKLLLRPVTRRLHALERRAGVLAHPAVAVVLYAGSMWLWHVPALYDAALGSDWIHALEHMTFASAGVLYWWHLLSPIRSRLRLRGLGPVAYMAATKLVVGLLGIVLTFSTAPLFGHYAHGPQYWGLTHSEDQSVAGLVMALEQSIVMGVALVVLLIRALADSEREAVRAERYGAT